jgi:hypothetical protein
LHGRRIDLVERHAARRDFRVRVAAASGDRNCSLDNRTHETAPGVAVQVSHGLVRRDAGPFDPDGGDSGWHSQRQHGGDSGPRPDPFLLEPPRFH